MRKILVFLAVLFFSGAAGAVETISTVSFNPSRIGDYAYLKVADKLTLYSGIKAEKMNITSSGTVTFNSLDSDATMYWIQETLIGEEYTSMRMPEAAIHGYNSNLYSGYKSENIAQPSNMLYHMTLYGGSATFSDDSYVYGMNAAGVRHKSGTLKDTRTVTITGQDGGSTTLYDDATTKGFHLAGNDIPVPTASFTNTGKTLTNCTLVWESRKTSDGQSVKVLALKNCR